MWTCHTQCVNPMGSGHSWQYKLQPSCVKLQWCGETPDEGAFISLLLKRIFVAGIKCGKQKRILISYNCCFNRRRDSQTSDGWREKQATNKQENSQARGLTGLKNILTDKQMGSLSQRGKYKHTDKTTKWQIAWWMDGWRADWGMWKWWINEWMWEDRLTYQLKDEWSSMTGCSGTLTPWQDKQGPTLHTQVHQKRNYPVHHFTCNHCWPQHAADVLWEVMVFDLIRKTFLYGTLCLWRERPCWTVGCPHGQQWICHLPSSLCKDSVPKHRIRRECVFALPSLPYVCMYCICMNICAYVKYTDVIMCTSWFLCFFSPGQNMFCRNYRSSLVPN